MCYHAARSQPHTRRTKYEDQLQKHFASDEILSALRSGFRAKRQASKGLARSFTPLTFKPGPLELLNQTFLHKKITPQQKHGIIIRLPKPNGNRTPDGCCSISLPTTEYKIVTGIIARHLRHAYRIISTPVIFAEFLETQSWKRYP